MYCIDDACLFPWKTATWGSCHLHTVPWGLEQAGGLQVPDVVMSPPTFYSFEHFIKTSKPSHNFHLLDRSGIWLGLFLSVASRFFPFLGWAGRERRAKGTSLLSPYLPLWCFYKATAGSTAQTLRGGAAVLTRHLPPAGVGGRHSAPVFVRGGE